MDEQRALLDMLMGKSRNLPDALKGTVKELHFSDRVVCKHFLCGICPYILFSATKSDLGRCPKEVCDNTDALLLREQYNLLPQSEKDLYGYEHDLMLFLEDLVRACDLRILKNKRRAEKEMSISEEMLQKLAAIETEIRAITEKCVAAAEEGNIDASQELSLKIDGLKEEAERITNPKDIKHTTVCEISGNFMSTRDNDERMRAHFEGKQFLGWKMVRDKLAEYTARGVGPPPAKPQRSAPVVAKPKERLEDQPPASSYSSNRPPKRKARSPSPPRSRVVEEQSSSKVSSVNPTLVSPQDNGPFRKQRERDHSPGRSSDRSNGHHQSHRGDQRPAYRSQSPRRDRRVDHSRFDRPDFRYDEQEAFLPPPRLPDRLPDRGYYDGPTRGPPRPFRSRERRCAAEEEPVRSQQRRASPVASRDRVRTAAGARPAELEEGEEAE